MITTININNRMTMISEMENDSIFQVLKYENLQVGSNLKISINIKSIIESGITLKQVRIILNNNAVKIQLGTLSFMKGNISTINSVNNNDKIRFRILRIINML